MNPPTPLPVDGARLYVCRRHADRRGYFNELYNERTYFADEWKQVSFSRSEKHVLRGLHCSPYAKFITCVRGAFYDVIADFRPTSPTFGKWCGVTLTDTNCKQLYVPAGCGHGFLALEDDTCALYLQEGTFDPEHEQDVHPFDPFVDVRWPIPDGVTPIVSDKDRAAPLLRTRLVGAVAEADYRPTRVLVVGASGQVGAAIVSAYARHNVRCYGTYHSQPVPGCVPYDLGTAPSTADALLELCRPDVVYICAGFTWVDGCEQDVKRANALNHVGPAALVRAAKRVGAKSVWYSTDYVFDGQAGPYSVECAPNPINVYGCTKRDGELAVLAADPDALVIRTNVVYGPDPQDKNFECQLRQKAQSGEEFAVADDQFNNPIHNSELAVRSLLLVATGAKGVQHVGGPDVLSRYEFAKLLCARHGWSVTLRPQRTFHRVAKRPLRSGLV